MLGNDIYDLGDWDFFFSAVEPFNDDATVTSDVGLREMIFNASVVLFLIKVQKLLCNRV